MRKPTLSLCFLAIVALCTAAPAAAQVVPYRVWGTGIYKPNVVPIDGCIASGPFSGPSQGLHMGRVAYEGFACFPSELNTGSTTSFIWTADDVQVAANGDELHLHGMGTWTPEVVGLDEETGEPILTAVWDGEWIIVGGTGRFANARSVSIRMIAKNLPFKYSDPEWEFTYEKVGQIDLGKRGKKSK
jgi:hypothetical protein